MIDEKTAHHIARSLLPDLRGALIEMLLDEPNELIGRLRERIHDDLVEEWRMDDVFADREEALRELYKEEFESLRERVAAASAASIAHIESLYTSVLVARAKEIEERLSARLLSQIERSLMEQMEKKVQLWIEYELARVFDKSFEKKLRSAMISSLAKHGDDQG